jgi:phosphoglycolate phosphatase
MKILIVSDFDGTINKKDLGEEFGKIIESYSDLKEKFIGNSLSAPDVYKRLLDVEGMSFTIIRDFYVNQAIIDEHFVPFLNFTKDKEIAHIIVSDGFDLLIEETLLKHGVKDGICVFANIMRDNGNKIFMDFPFWDNDCSFSGVCKKRIMRAFRPYFDRIIYIGNGYSDIDAVPEADIVFARSLLKSYCNENKIPSFWYDNYGDIIKKLDSSFKGIIFDLDGTLIDSFSAIYESFNYTMRGLGLPENSYEDVLKTIGMPLEDVMAHINGIGDPVHAVRMFRSNYEKIYLDKTTLLDGVRQVVEELSKAGYLMGVSTNKLGKYSRSLLEHLGIGKYFRNVVGIGDGLRSKPDPDTIEKIRLEFGLPKEQVVYVGDSLVDAQTAANAGVSFIGVATGPVPFSELTGANAEVVLDSFSRLPAYLKPLS